MAWRRAGRQFAVALAVALGMGGALATSSAVLSSGSPAAAGAGLGAAPGAPSSPGTTAGGGAGTPAGSALGPAVALTGSVEPLPSGSVRVGPLAGATTVTGEVGLPPADPAALQRFLRAVSTPGDPLYHHYLARGQYGARFGASPGAIAAVTAWLHAAGIDATSVTANRTAVRFTAPADRVPAAFGAHLERFRLPTGRVAYAPDRAPLLPRSLAGVVTGVAGLSDVARPVSHVAAPGGLDSGGSGPVARASGTGGPAPRVSANVSGPHACSAAASTASSFSSYTQDQLAGAYGLAAASGPYSQGRLGAGVTVAIFELEPYTTSDITTFQSCFATSAQIQNVNVDGGPGSGSQQGEAALDIEQVIGLAPQAKIMVYQGPATANTTQVLDVYTKIATDDLAQVASTSWGLCEANAGSSFANLEASQAVDQMAAQGQSVFAASGDRGSEDCGGTALAVDDPGSQPTVTSVGGTSLTALGPPPSESVWNDNSGAGGGGESSIWSQPTYQQNDGTGLSVRTVPDVTGSADPVHGTVIYFQGSWGVIGGTSAAAPLWAAVLADIDQGCVGSPSPHWGNVVGEANPAIYRAAEAVGSTAFHDVTSGNNDFTSSYTPRRYLAGTGYDMASGWGSPNAPSLFTALQPAGGCPTVTGLSATTGPGSGGTSVTISGSDLASATSVTFGGVSAPISSNTASSVTVTSPPSCGSSAVDVVVTTASGTSAAVSLDRFTYTTGGCPTTIAVTSGSGQQANVNTAFANPLVATVTDGLGTPVAGVAVTFGAPASGTSGTFASCPGGNPHPYSCVATTNGSGVATSSVLTAGGLGGGFNVSANASGTNTVNFSETANGPGWSGASGSLGELASNTSPWTITNATAVAGGPTISGSPDVVYDSADGHLHVFVRTGTSHLVEYVNDNIGGHLWNYYDHTADAGGGGDIAASPFGVYDTADNLIHVYVEASNGHLVEYLSDHANGKIWNAYDHTVDAGGGGTVAAAPDAVYTSLDNLVHVYVEASNGHLVEYLSDHANGNIWNAYDHTVDAGGGGTIAASPDAVYTSFDSLVHVYVRAANGHLVEYLSDHANGKIWNAYDHTVDAGGGGTIVASPGAVFTPGGSNLVHVYVEASNGDLVEYLSDHANGHVWNAYDHTVDAGGGGTIAASPAAVLDTGSGTVHVFVRAGNGDIVEYVPDNKAGHPWNAYDRTVDSAGPQTTAAPSAVDQSSVAYVFAASA